MAKEKQITKTENSAPVIHVGPSPHLVSDSTSTRKMMMDVLIALGPVVGMAIYVFRMYAVKQILIAYKAY